MTRGKVRVIAHRRRREGKTDYRHRLALLKSGSPRLVVRKAVNSMTCQIIEHKTIGDKAIVSVTSKNLEGFGWKGNKGNLPGSYLTGFLCGTEAKKNGVKKAVLDIGLQTSTKGSRIYAAVRGCLDAGIDIPHSPEILPNVERIRGLHIEQYAESRGKKVDISTVFDAVKKSIESGKTPTKTTTKKPKKPPAKKSRKK
jgi:large subunit ribosomal protein L18